MWKTSAQSATPSAPNAFLDRKQPALLLVRDTCAHTSVEADLRYLVHEAGIRRACQVAIAKYMRLR